MTSNTSSSSIWRTAASTISTASFPGAQGLANGAATATQVDKDGKPYATLPPPINTNEKPPAADTRFPADLPNKPFEIGQYVAIDKITGDLVHRF